MIKCLIATLLTIVLFLLLFTRWHFIPIQVESPPQGNLEAINPILTVIDQLVEKESEGKTDIVILDTNNKHSFSCLQFQMSTFKQYVKRYNLLPEAEDHEIENMIMDCDFQKLVAYKMLEENPNNILHWRTSARKLNLI